MGFCNLRIIERCQNGGNGSEANNIFPLVDSDIVPLAEVPSPMPYWMVDRRLPAISIDLVHEYVVSQSAIWAFGKTDPTIVAILLSLKEDGKLMSQN